MDRRDRTRGWAVLAGVALLGGLVRVPAGGEPGPAPAEHPAAALGSLGLPLEDLLGRALGTADDAAGPARFKVPGAVRILVLSSGIDAESFGEAYGERLSVHGGGDGIGLGTYAASVLFQVAPEAKLTSINVYDGERVHREKLIQALEFARDHADDVDSIALAFPPSEVLDPAGAGLTSGRWSELSDAGEGASGSLRNLSERWGHLRTVLGELSALGLTAVAPAGDLGPAPQSVLGVAGLPEVVTVGAAHGAGVAPASSSGPSVHGGAKPDLVAPVGLPGLVPEKSALAAVLAGAAPVDRDRLDLPFPAAGGRPALLGSTIPAAVSVAATLAQLRLDGIDDRTTVRGVLNAAADPEPGVPAWRQGAGILRRLPGAELARTRPLVGGPLDFGAEPAPGRPWTAAAPIVGGRRTGAPTVSIPGRIETTATGTRAPVDAPEGAPRPVPTFTEAAIEGPEVAAPAEVLRLALPAGDNPWAPGAWCGYVQVPLSGGVTEDVPTCLVEGLSLNALNAYIHDVPAEDLTFALIPALPPGASLLTGPLLVLPVDPLHEPALAGVSGPDGMVHFANVPPAFYVMRQFSDYGAPVTEHYEGDGRNRTRDLGEAAAYLGFDALVLPNPCPERIEDNRETGTDCHQAWLEGHAGPAGYDPSTARYVVETPAGPTGVVFDFAKKVAGVGVTSRYVDLVAHEALRHRSAVSLDDTLGPLPERLGLPLEEAWTFGPAGALNDPEGTLATYRGLDLQSDPTSVAGTSTYPFALSTPNYQGRMSLNFRYDIDDALLGVLVQVAGKGPHGVLLTPQGKIELPHVDPHKPLAAALLRVAEEPPGRPGQADPARLFGAATGQVGIDLDLHPTGAAEGLLTLVYVPLEPARPAAIHVGDLSFEVTTWQRIDWPRAQLARDGAMVRGHAFRFDSNYSARQMDHPACRRLAEGDNVADVCENWQVLVHSPLDDAETFDLVDPASGRRFLAEARTGGAGFFAPHRGVHGSRDDFAVAGVALPLGRGVVTNGRFWEQLVIPAPVLAAHADTVEVHIEDNQAGGRSPLLPHADGPAPLRPYVPYTPWHRHVEAGLLDDLGPNDLGSAR